MRTLILSDLHLGVQTGSDLLRRAEFRAPLLEAVADVDRVILLGDVLELRHGPLRDALNLARPFFEALGEALGDGELILIAGNHDHALVEPWLVARAEAEEREPLALEQLIEPSAASPPYGRISGWVGKARIRVAYPGLWVRPDVYATHGHYLDVHLTVPTLERLSVGAMGRLLGRVPASFDRVGDYESVGAPIFAWRDAVARDARRGRTINGIATDRAWYALRNGRSGAPASLLARDPRRALRALRGRAVVAAFPLAVAALNRAGLGPLNADISLLELRRAGLQAMGEVAAHLGLGDAYVIFGHTHRTGPLPGDNEYEWLGRGGARLLNTGSWTYAAIFLHQASGENPYWPGSCVLVEDTGPPQVMRLLQDRTLKELHAALSR